ncbi:MAG: type II toxin-antitoxin system RelE/ParE family toxin [Chlorobiaceae bacterium]|nr:type II toxin-antitoxin system RelE/ParE family toxin [Chlorobiaceae bacterium]
MIGLAIIWVCGFIIVIQQRHQVHSFSCRKATQDNPLLRELLILFGNAGYVALFEIDDKQTITILAIRHQREDDYYR